jgi:uncharacterized protein with von Willebrand factor type A (vWA) domain
MSTDELNAGSAAKALDDIGELIDQLAAIAREFDFNTANRMERDAAKALLIIEGAINALPGLIESARKVERLEAALQDAHTWHESADKAISKQPNANQGANGWNRLQHQEQMELISNVLKGT